MGLRGYLAHRPGGFLTNAGVKILKVIKLRLPSWSMLLCLNLLARKGGGSEVLSESFFSFFLNNQLKINTPKGKTLVPFRTKSFGSQKRLWLFACLGFWQSYECLFPGVGKLWSNKNRWALCLFISISSLDSLLSPALAVSCSQVSWNVSGRLAHQHDPLSFWACSFRTCVFCFPPRPPSTSGSSSFLVSYHS